jgi:hypothetical protein
MKKLCVFLLAAFLLAGCTEKKTFETISDGLETPRLPAMLEMAAVLPEGATSPVLSTEATGKLYEYNDCTVTMQAVTAGDFSGLIREITGYAKENLQLMESVQAGLPSYQVVWTAAGEGQTQVGRACILTDGNYYYVLTAMVPESKAGALSKGELKEMFQSFRAIPEQEVISSGS